MKNVSLKHYLNVTYIWHQKSETNGCCLGKKTEATNVLEVDDIVSQVHY